MKKIFITLICALCTMHYAFTQSSEQYLRDFTSGSFRPQTMAALYSMNDGTTYTMLSEDGTKIIKYDYKSGNAIETIFDIATAKNCSLKKISDYQFDPQEKRILILTDKTPIYRHSFSTIYYVYNIARNELEPLSQNPEPQNLAQFSPNGRMIAFARGNNLFIKKLDFNTELQITKDGEFNKIINGTADWVYEEEFGCTRYFEWSPDSKLLAWVRFDESEIKQFSFDVYDHPYDNAYTYKYPKAGETNSTVSVHVYDTENRTTKQMNCGTGNDIYFPIIQWTNNNESLAIVRLNRNQTTLDLLSVNPRSGVAKTLLSETDKVYIDYTNYTHLKFNSDNSFVAMSERDGWRHIYLHDNKGQIKRQITKGEWVVRNVNYVDEANQVIYFTASGFVAGEDPYNIHYCRIGFDGKGFQDLTPENGNHIVKFSADRNYFVDVYSRPDFPAVSVLRRTSDGSIITELESCDVSDLVAKGWVMPEVFCAKGRDGKTDIWGNIHRPSNFDPSKSYPVVEMIYAGPHDSHVVKDFRPANHLITKLTELGFIVVSIDGMGTSNRSKAFHDVCWKNLKDAGFPDRIAWMKAAAKKYQYMDLERVGIYGWSAGGQNAMAALLFHNDFYKVAVALCGCHDNRMDKVWWNEQWMGYPVDSSYVASSNVEHAKNLKGKLMLVVGEMDDNVDPSSTYQVVNALQQAGKDFEFILLPGARHTMGERFGEHKRYDFFVKHLMKTTPPEWDDLK